MTLVHVQYRSQGLYLGAGMMYLPCTCAGITSSMANQWLRQNILDPEEYQNNVAVMEQ